MELGQRQFTNVLVEGGGQVMGTLLDTRCIDEVHAFVAPMLSGGQASLTPIAGQGVARIADSLPLESPNIHTIGDNIYISGRIIQGS